MASQRGEQVPHPAAGRWTLRFADDKTAKGWRDIKATARNNLAEAWVWLTNDPRHHTSRQHQLRSDLATGVMDGKTLEQWQYEVTSGGRLRYLIDDATKTVWLVQAKAGHPKDTD